MIMEKEQKFMLIFRFTPTMDYQPTEQEEAQIHEQWGNFIGNIALKEKLVSTHQLGFEGKQIAADSSIADGIAILDKQTIGGNMIVRANSIDEATTMAKDCPILQMGGTVEIRSIQPMEN